MVPNIIHFIYVGGRPFSFIHFLAVYTAYKVNKPEQIYFHHTEEPSGKWWDMARPLLKLNRVAPVNEIFGNPVIYPAHKADIIRLEMLRQFGGIYLDLDIISINPFKPLLKYNFVMGIEPGTGLCNAVIIASKDAPFLELWQEKYKTFNKDLWNFHSVILPGKMAKEFPELIYLADKYNFFYPTHNDPVCEYLWGNKPNIKSLAIRMGKNIVMLVTMWLKRDQDPIKLAFYETFHGLHGKKWHYSRAQKSYCIHLWEGLWGKPYLDQLSPEYLQSNPSNFARLMRNIIPMDELEAMAKGQPIALPMS